MQITFNNVLWTFFPYGYYFTVFPIGYSQSYWKYLQCCFIAQSCPTLLWPMDCSPPGSSVHRISQARILEWVVISFPSGSSLPKDQTHISCFGRWVLYHWATMDALICCKLVNIHTRWIKESGWKADWEWELCQTLSLWAVPTNNLLSSKTLLISLNQ